MSKCIIYLLMKNKFEKMNKNSALIAIDYKDRYIEDYKDDE